jgi:hypothetical protein
MSVPFEKWKRYVSFLVLACNQYVVRCSTLFVVLAPLSSQPLGSSLCRAGTFILIVARRERLGPSGVA